MDENAFWELIERSGRETGTRWGSLDGFEYFVKWLVSLGRAAFEQVAAGPDRVIELPEFLRPLEVRRERLANDEFPVWSAEEEPEFELLGYVTFGPYEKATGLDVVRLGDAVHARGVRGKFPLIGAAFDGEEWDFGDETEFARGLPRLTAYRGVR